MAKYKNLNVCGWHAEYDGPERGMQTCGLNEIGNFGFVQHCKNDTDCEQFLKELAEKYCYNEKAQGNFIFSVSSSNLGGDGRASTGSVFLLWLLKQSGTSIIHHYTNNAHGPNMIFICMHHMFLDQIKRSDIVNNIEEYRSRHVYNKHTNHWELK